MKTGHENEVDPRNPAPELWSNVDDFAIARPDTNVVFSFAMQLAGAASNAPFLILIYIVLTHVSNSSTRDLIKLIGSPGLRRLCAR